MDPWPGTEEFVGGHRGRRARCVGPRWQCFRSISKQQLEEPRMHPGEGRASKIEGGAAFRIDQTASRRTANGCAAWRRPEGDPSQDAADMEARIATWPAAGEDADRDQLERRICGSIMEEASEAASDSLCTGVQQVYDVELACCQAADRSSEAAGAAG